MVAGKVRCLNSIRYIYLPFLNFRFLRQIFIAFSSFAETFWWCIRGKRDSSVIIYDVLNISISKASLLAARLFRYKTCAIVTDIPELISQKNEKTRWSFFEWVISLISSKSIGSYDIYIFLTEQMNELINIRKKPCLIMEGLVDVKMLEFPNLLENKTPERILLYSGGIYKKYGIKNLIEAFRRLTDSDLRLDIYGSGEMETEMPEIMKQDSRISYYGVLPNDEIVKKQIEATLLINPRFSDQEFTKYSFPSKNMEYMVSGTPLVTTPLPGMPAEYRNYVYLFNDESVEGMHNTLRSLLSKPRNELHNMGCNAKRFVLENKNNIIQTRRLINILNNISS